MKKVLYIDQKFKEGFQVVEFANNLFKNNEVSMIIFYVEGELCIQTMFESFSFIKQFFPDLYLDEDNVMAHFLHYDFSQIEIDDFLEILRSHEDVEIEYFSKEEKYTDFRKAS